MRRKRRGRVQGEGTGAGSLAPCVGRRRRSVRARLRLRSLPHQLTPVNKVEVKVARLELAQRLLERGRGLVGPEVSGPELAREEHLLALADAARDAVRQRVAHLALVVVARRAVDCRVARLERRNDSLAHLVLARLPGAEPEERHRVARRRELHRRQAEGRRVRGGGRHLVALLNGADVRWGQEDRRRRGRGGRGDVARVKDFPLR